MNSIAIFLCMMSCVGSMVINKDEYMKIRNEILTQEFDGMIGSDLILNENESALNDILMREKKSEIELAYNKSRFLPAINFFLAKDEIDQSKVFQIIRKLPKGAMLHTHDPSGADANWVIKELTYHEDLYMCEPGPERIIFKYFSPGNESECENWMKVSDVRSQMGNGPFNDKIKKQITMVTDSPTGAYSSTDVAWVKFLNCFESIISLLSLKDSYVKYKLRAAQFQVEDGVNYVEFRGLWPELIESDGRVLSVQEYVELLIEMFNNFTIANSQSYYGVRMIPSGLRGFDKEQVKPWLTDAIKYHKMFPNFMLGFDLVGQEDPGHPLKYFIDMLLETNDTIPFYFHAGETNYEGLDVDENLVDAILFNVKRIGHAFAITKHPNLMKMAKDRGIAIEINPISNQLLGHVHDLRNHPAAVLAAQNFPMVISSDDNGLFTSTPLSHDFYEAFFAFGGAKADLRFIKQLAINSIRYSSLNDAEKDELMTLWNNNWNDAVSKLVTEYTQTADSNLNSIDPLGKFLNKFRSETFCNEKSSQ